jgi:hypothetical protein
VKGKAIFDMAIGEQHVPEPQQAQRFEVTVMQLSADCPGLFSVVTSTRKIALRESCGRTEGSAKAMLSALGLVGQEPRGPSRTTARGRVIPPLIVEMSKKEGNPGASAPIVRSRVCRFGTLQRILYLGVSACPPRGPRQAFEVFCGQRSRCIDGLQLIKRQPPLVMRIRFSCPGELVVNPVCHVCDVFLFALDHTLSRSNYSSATG